MTIFKYASCLIPYIVSFLILCGEWPSLMYTLNSVILCNDIIACFFTKEYFDVNQNKMISHEYFRVALREKKLEIFKES